MENILSRGKKITYPLTKLNISMLDCYGIIIIKGNKRGVLCMIWGYMGLE